MNSLSCWPAVVEVPATMTAVVLDRHGPPDVLTVREVPTPRAGADEVVVRVGAVGIGRLLDLRARAGAHTFTTLRLPHVLGAEHAGTVVAAGSQVTSVDVGDRVAVFPVVSCGTCASCRRGRQDGCASLEVIGAHRPGAYAEYCVSPARNCRRVPADLGLGVAEAAAMALTGPVAMHQLLASGLRPGHWVFVQGASSGLGALTADLARHLGARVVVASRSPGKRAALAGTGAAAVVDPLADDVAERIRAVTGGQGVDLVVDNLGDPRIWDAGLAALAPFGTVVTSGAFLGGRVSLDLGALYLRNQRVLGVRTGTPASAERFWSEVGRGFRTAVDRSFPLSRARDAHAHLERDGGVGRVVLVT